LLKIGKVDWIVVLLAKDNIYIAVVVLGWGRNDNVVKAIAV